MKRVLGNWRHTGAALFTCWLMCSALQAQKFSGTGGKITDDAIPSIFSIKVAGLPSKIDRSFGLEKVCVNIKHTWDNDLSIYLVAPDGSVVDLARRNGGGHDDYTNTCFSNDAETSINAGDPPFTGSFLPEVPMGGINNGQNPNGVWKLYVVDTYPREESGSLISWSISFGKDPAQPTEFASSTLPIVVMQSAGVPVLDEPKTKVHMHIIDNGPGKKNSTNDKANGYNGFVGIELRGRSSQRHPKLSFAIETLDSAGQKSKAAKLLDLPKDADYVLIANHSDKSLLRNYLAYTLYGEMAAYAPHMRLVDVVMDGQYRGVYLLGEKVKRGKDRVNISKLDADDNAGDSLTGGYIFKTDWAQGANNGGWFSKYYPIRGKELQEFRFHYPEADDITDAQKSYLQQYVDSFEVAIDSGFTDTKTGYAHFIDIGSFVDMMIMVELGKNVDGYWLSSFYYKDRLSKGGKIHAGPIWDYDLAFGNFEYYQGYAPNGWHWETYGKTSTHIPRFWHFLAQDKQFQDSLQCRWAELRKSVLSLKHIDALIDAAAAKIGDSQKYNFEVWPIWGIYTWPNAKPYEENYESEIARLKDWFLMRITWMDAHMPGACK